MRRQTVRTRTPLWLSQMVEPFADTAGRPDPGRSWPCGCPAAPTRSTKSPGADTADAGRADTDAGRRTSTPGHWTPRHPDIGHRTRGHRMRGHRTPDTWTLTEEADRATKARQASGHLGHHDHPTARWTSNRGLWTAPAARSATMTARSGEAPVSGRPPTGLPGHLLGRSVGRAAPRRTALLGRISGRA
jgi:hypothetical protein